MQNSLNILLVEDSKTIADAYKLIFESEGNSVCSAHDADSAISIINETPSCGFDLLFTDIDLVGDPTKGADKSGIAFARYAHKIIPNIPIVGHSAYFDDDDLSPEERACFDAWFPKGIKTADREDMFSKTLSLAKERRRSRMSSIQENKETKISDLLNVPTSSKEFGQMGYQKEVIKPSETNKFIQPFSVWRRDSEEGCELEIVGCPAILAWGESVDVAYEHLFDFIHTNLDLAVFPREKLRGSSLSIANFIRKITQPNKE